MHGMFFSSEVEALRAFFRDKLGFPCYDAGGGWLIFEMPPADLGVHPITHEGAPPSGTAEISFSCDDIARTRDELAARGVEFTQEIRDQGFGLVTRFKLPGDFSAQLYQPKYGKP